MAMLKFGFSSQAVIDSFTDVEQSRYNPESAEAKKAGEQFRRTVTAAKGVIKKSADFLYVRTRAIGSLEKWGPNMNGDGFPMTELAKSYQTFVGKGNFIDHKSDDITKIRGLVIDAYLNKDDQCVECLIAVDRKSHPQLSRDIETGTVNSVSMGTRVGWSLCSVCTNRARTERDYCSHIQNYKGMKIGFLTNNEAHRKGAWPVHEVNHDLEFIELSWVAVPAFADAHVLEKIASLKRAVDNGFKPEHDETTELSEAEKSILAFTAAFHEAKGELIAETAAGINHNIPNELVSVAEAAACKSDECSFDIRKPAVARVTTAAEMRRVTITRDKSGFRHGPKDYECEGKVVIDGKDYEWYGSSKDKTTWNISLEKDLHTLISSGGQQQLIDGIKQLMAQNIDSSELIVANSEIHMKKTGYFQNFTDDPLMKGKRIDKMLQEQDSDRTIYPNKNLEVPGVGDVRDVEQETFEGTAKDGPSGAIGKSLPAKDETLNHEELKLKEEMKRAYLKYLSRKANK